MKSDYKNYIKILRGLWASSPQNVPAEKGPQPETAAFINQ